MAMTICKECGCQISSKAMTCPHCGVRLNKNRGGATAILIIISILFIAFFLREDKTIDAEKEIPVASIKKPGPSLWSINDATAQILDKIQCDHQSLSPAGDGLGPIFGCYNDSEEIKIWINGYPEDNGETMNVKLTALKYNGRKMDKIGPIWLSIMAEMYGGDKAGQIKKAFNRCPVDKTFDSGRYKISINTYKGSGASSHTMIIEPK